MKTERPDTTEGNGTDEPPENVVRLPRDWLGPPEELVPMGSRARALHHSSGDSSDDFSALPLAADDFWGEGTGAVQHPIQGPTAPVPDDDRPRTTSPPHRFRLADRRLGLPRRRRVPVRWTLGGLAAGILAVIVIATIGVTEGSSSGRTRPTATTAQTVMAAAHAASATEPGRSTLERPSMRRLPARHLVRRARANQSPSRDRHATRHRVHAKTVTHHTVTHSASPAPPIQTTVTTPSVVPTSPSETPTVTSPATSHEGGRTSPSAPAGPTGIGSAIGCSAKCA